jgi:chromosomal replication initiation ATPase DnaA
MGIYEFTEEELTSRQTDVDPGVGKERDPNVIARQVAKRYGLAVPVLLGRSHALHVVRARKVLYRELRESGMSYPSIGAFVGRDHTTVMNGLKRVMKRDL